jgi:hypothetical protein
MDIAGIAADSTVSSRAQLLDAVQMAVLRKALDLEGQSALQLVQSAAQIVFNNPPNLGNSIDTYA